MMRRAGVALVLLGLVAPSCAFLEQLRRDYAALNMRATARHIMRPNTEKGRLECLVIVRELRAAEAAGEFVVDAFAKAAASKSIDPDTRGTGGLLGERLPQGAVRARALDQACFTAPLGRITGPIESEYGLHIVLVQERLGCRFDEGNTRVVARPAAASGDDSDSEGPLRVESVLAPPESGSDGGMEVGAVVATGATWAAVVLAGGVFAEVAASIGAAAGL